MRVLLIAEAANPEWVSVPLEGWSHARAIARACDAHLVTQVRNREAILRAGLVEGRDFTAIDSERVARLAWRAGELLRGGRGKGWTTVTAFASLAYGYFERLVWRRFGAGVEAGGWDVVHRLTPLSPTAPSRLATKCRRAGVPFVLGPLNGGAPWPREFDAARRQEREWLSYVRSAYRLLPGYRATLRDAAAVVVGSLHTRDQIPARHAPKCVYVPENAIDPTRFTARRRGPAARPLKAVFLGRLVPYKGPDMLVEAAAPLVRAGLLEVDLLGDGMLMEDLRRTIAREGVGGGIRLRGWVEHAQVAEAVASADVLAFPSVREFGGAVALEAMATGVVPIVVDYAGPAELVTERTGFKIPLGPRAAIVAELRRVLERLAEDPAQVDAKSGAAYRRAHEQFTWDAKARQVLEVYDWVTGRAPKPDFPAPLPDLAE